MKPIMLFLMLVSIFHKAAMKECTCKKYKDDCREKMIENNILPTVIRGFKTSAINIEFLFDTKVKCGGKIPLPSMALRPTITFNAKLHKCCDCKCKYFTIIMLDVGKKEKIDPYVTWMINDVPRYKLQKGYNGGVLVITEERFIYQEPRKTGNLYVVLLHCQPEKIGGNGIAGIKIQLQGRPNFNDTQWAMDNGLAEPVAATFFKVVVTDVVDTESITDELPDLPIDVDGLRKSID